MNHKSREIDAAALQAALRRKGFTLGKASTRMGYASSYLSQASRKRSLPEPVIRALEGVCGVDPAEYCKDAAAQENESAGLVMAIEDQTKKIELMAEDVDNLRFVLNMIAGDLKRLVYELVPEEKEDEYGIQTDGL